MCFEFFSDNRADEDESGLKDGRITSSSTIRFRPTSVDNGVTFACEAEHPALLNHPLRSTVLISVLRKEFFSVLKIIYCESNAIRKILVLDKIS